MYTDVCSARLYTAESYFKMFLSYKEQSVFVVVSSAYTVPLDVIWTHLVSMALAHVVERCIATLLARTDTCSCNPTLVLNRLVIRCSYHHK
jgi:hypothetical protein